MSRINFRELFCCEKKQHLGTKGNFDFACQVVPPLQSITPYGRPDV